MRSASGDVDVASWGARIGELGKRELVMKTARQSHPSLFTSRWAMSFFRGPLTRAELLRLREAEALPRPAGAPVAAGSAAAGAAVRSGAGSGGDEGVGGAPAAHQPLATSPALADLAHDETPVAPTVSAEARVRYLDPAAPWAREIGVSSGDGTSMPGWRSV